MIKLIIVNILININDLKTSEFTLSSKLHVTYPPLEDIGNADMWLPQELKG